MFNVFRSTDFDTVLAIKMRVDVPGRARAHWKTLLLENDRVVSLTCLCIPFRGVFIDWLGDVCAPFYIDLIDQAPKW